MKQKDIATLAAIVVFGAIIAFVASTLVFSGANKRDQQVKTVDAINDQFQLPNRKYFSQQSINPAQEVNIGNTTNQNPFTGSKQ